MTSTIPRLALDPAEAATACGVKRDTVMKAIRAGQLRAKRSGANGGGKYLVLVADLQSWLESMGDA